MARPSSILLLPLSANHHHLLFIPGAFLFESASRLLYCLSIRIFLLFIRFRLMHLRFLFFFFFLVSEFSFYSLSSLSIFVSSVLLKVVIFVIFLFLFTKMRTCLISYFFKTFPFLFILLYLIF